MTASGNSLPRELAPGVFWLGDCLEQHYRDQILHAYDSLYVVVGDDCALLVEGGHPQDLAVVERQLDGVLARAGVPLRHVFTTHQEVPHASGVGRLLERYPDAVVRGDVRDFAMAFPGFEDRLVPLEEGEAVELGGTTFVAVQAVLRDYISTLWGFDTRGRVLFAGDGFSYSHYHQAGQCGSVAEEVPALPIAEMTALFSELALHWTRFTAMEPYIERLEQVIEGLGARVVAPTHGLPITDIAATFPLVREGLLMGSAETRVGDVG